MLMGLQAMIPTTLDLPSARHLAARACLGEEWQLIDRWQGRSPREIVQTLLSGSTYAPQYPPSFASWSHWTHLLKNGEMGQARQELIRDKHELKKWWIHHLLTTHTPFIERMVLFWQNHFTTSLDKVNQPSLIIQQQQLIRKEALGNFATMLHGISRDPAMLIYLDGSMNHKDKPNENYAREVMELFTLGEGYYTEQDIKTASRAFTGWHVNRDTGQFLIDNYFRDGRPGWLLEHPGISRGEEVLNVLLNHPRTAELIAEKCWYAFVSSQAHDPQETKRWAHHFRESRYDIKVLMENVLLSRAFWDERNRGMLSKSPFDLITSSFRALPLSKVSTGELVTISEQLGQNPFVPPSPQGWKEGKHWITPHSLVKRYQALSKFSHTLQPSTALPDLPANDVVKWLLPTRPAMRLSGNSQQAFMQAAMLDPAYQLK